MEQGAAMFDGAVVAWSELEGWYVVAPGNVQEYLEYLADERARRERDDIPE